MNKFFAFFTMFFRNSFVYRTAIIFSIFGAVLAIVAKIAVWKFIFIYDEDMVKYMIKYVIISVFLGIVLTDNISGRLGNKVMNGDFVFDLLKPISQIHILWSIALILCNT